MIKPYINFLLGPVGLVIDGVIIIKEKDWQAWTGFIRLRIGKMVMSPLGSKKCEECFSYLRNC
jgi:hypothetical protein